MAEHVSDRGGINRAEPWRVARAAPGDSITTSWGYGPNENAFNQIVVDAVPARWPGLLALAPILVKAMIAVESEFNPNATSPTGKAGLMQLSEEDAVAQGLSLSPVDERYIPEKNVPAGVGVLGVKAEVILKPLVRYPGIPWAEAVAGFYARHGLPRVDQAWKLILSAYNGGGQTVLRAMTYGIADGGDPREWKNLTAPKDAPERSPLYRALVDVFGRSRARAKYREMAPYAGQILALATRPRGEES